MSSRLKLAVVLAGASLLLASACSRQGGDTEEVRRFAVDGMEGILADSSVAFDSDVTSDGDGAIRIDATRPMTVRLYEAGDIDIENARLIYRAQLRAENLEGQAYLEMWCHFDEKGQFFSRALQAPISGTVDWTLQETPFFLKKGENPDRVRLNLVVRGTGTVWIDDIRLLKGPLQ